MPIDNNPQVAVDRCKKLVGIVTDGLARAGGPTIYEVYRGAYTAVRFSYTDANFTQLFLDKSCTIQPTPIILFREASRLILRPESPNLS